VGVCKINNISLQWLNKKIQRKQLHVAQKKCFIVGNTKVKNMTTQSLSGRIF